MTRAKCEGTPVYQLDKAARFSSSRLPRIWVSEPVFDFEANEYIGRKFVASYPCDNDADGSRAYGFGLTYFSEAISCSSESPASLREDCFRAAEVLFLHAAERGCVEALVKLGILYKADLCQGSYCFFAESDAISTQSMLDAKAFECFAIASSFDNEEACRMLGEMVAQGRGCPQDGKAAFGLYLKAFDLADDRGDFSQRGYAALRIAEAFEEGLAGSHSFKKAYHWYRIAEDDLAYVVDRGGWYYKRPRAKALMGVKRMRQELLGGY